MQECPGSPVFIPGLPLSNQSNQSVRESYCMFVTYFALSEMNRIAEHFNDVLMTGLRLITLEININSKGILAF